ncbi:MAG: peptide deformylase [Pirellulales bacterium]
MQVIQYPHPTLRHVSKPLRRVDAALRQIIREMFDVMYEAKGIGLAANQVDLPLRLFVVNLKGDPAASSEERVYINPVIANRRGQDEAEEGCLSLPGLYAEVRRPETVVVKAYDLSGNEINQEAAGILGRVLQHETDHLDGVLFTDRLSETGRLSLKEELEEFETIYGGRRERGEIPDDKTLRAQLAEWESRYC